jgi:pimeloyl-ACP methyl ester carboxylesterase
VTTQPWETIGPPPLALFALEQGRAAFDLIQLRRRRRILRALRYDAHGWELGLNMGPTPTLREKLLARFTALRALHDGRRVSLVGWSLGGIYARELARAHPDQVRIVITLATPFRDISATHAARLVGLRPGGRPLREARELHEHLRRPLPVPATSIYSRTDGIVAWRSCLEEEGPGRESVEVACSHTGMGFHPEALAVIADRLAQPEGAWRPYRSA